jgi:ADP-ribosyl-[dinitrogen reductase] hydrolase
MSDFLLRPFHADPSHHAFARVVFASSGGDLLDARGRQRALGCLVGAAVGDALGAPFEFQPSGRFSERFPTAELGGRGEMIGGGSFGWAPGEFTDDTQMALSLAASLVGNFGYDADHVWESWRAWRRTAADVGITTSHALSHSSWREVTHARIETTVANGALMRAFPLALATLGLDDDTACAVVLHQASLSHHHPAAGWGAWLAVSAMRVAITGQDPFADFDRQMDRIPEGMRESFAAVLSPTWRPDHDDRSNGNVWTCLGQAVWAVRHSTSYESAVVSAIDLGGDTDTVACVTGALAGAIHGIQTIPSRWTSYVHGRVDLPSGTRVFDYAGLLELGHQLLGMDLPGQAPGESPAGPVEMVDGVHAANLLGAGTVPSEWGVVSMCRTDDLFATHEARRQVYMIDKEGGRNASLDFAVRDAVLAIEAFRREGRPVVVHCHGGRSRTGLVLKAWHMARTGCSEREAHSWLAERWPLYADYNRTFVEYLQSADFDSWVSPEG